MTERLYYRDATLLSFEAQAVAHDGDATRVILDRTAFYPTSGGQPHDTGTLGTANVIDVIDAGDGIVHVLDAPLDLGPVIGNVAEPRRRDHVQQHSAQHLLSALAEDRLGWHTASVHFGVDHSAIEFDTAAATNEELQQLEGWANELVAQALPVTVSFEDAATVSGLRKPTDRSGEVRVITIAGVDRNACGGTHVATTAEIGSIVISGNEKVRGRSRVAFLAGARTLARLHHLEELAAHLAVESSCSVDELRTLVPRRQVELSHAAKRIELLEVEVAAARLHRLAAAEEPGPGGIRRVVYRGPDEGAAMLRRMAQSAAALEGVIFVATTPSPPSVLFGTSTDSGVDAGAVLKDALAAVGGRGAARPASPRARHRALPTCATSWGACSAEQCDRGVGSPGR